MGGEGAAEHYDETHKTSPFGDLTTIPYYVGEFNELLLPGVWPVDMLPSASEARFQAGRQQWMQARVVWQHTFARRNGLHRTPQFDHGV